MRRPQDWLGKRLVAGEAAAVFYDRGSGECADFLTVEVEEDGTPAVKLYHCKGAGGEPSGERVDDLYDVCGQVTKSVRWRNKKRLVEHVGRWLRSGSRFLKGNHAEFIELMNSYPGLEFPLEVFIVQPGVSIRQL